MVPFSVRTGKQKIELVSGGYFYGGEFPIVHMCVLTKEFFTSPTFEPVYSHPEGGEVAQAWLAELMQAAEDTRHDSVLFYRASLSDTEQPTRHS